jgi:hypothetical protein
VPFYGLFQICPDWQTGHDLGFSGFDLMCGSDIHVNGIREHFLMNNGGFSGGSSYPKKAFFIDYSKRVFLL